MSDGVTKEVALVFVKTSENFGHLCFGPVLGVSKVSQGRESFGAKQGFDVFVFDHVTSNSSSYFTQKIVVTDWNLNYLSKNSKSVITSLTISSPVPAARGLKQQ